MRNHELAPNVHEFLGRASELYGRFQAEQFSHEMFSTCIEKVSDSPIEHLLWIAMHVTCATEFQLVNPDPQFDSNGVVHFPPAVWIAPQAQVGVYRVDFEVNKTHWGANFGSPVIVELDGHAFHDKDKRQRSYEKARDRFLVKSGYRVLHFTGSDVVADPFRVAYEVLELLGVTGDYPYDPTNPLGIE